MLALQLETNFEYLPDTEWTPEWTMPSQLDVEQMGCLIAIMLKILDGKCAMNSESKDHVIEIYKSIEKTESNLFDPGIHTLIRRVLEEPELLLLMHVHELRLYAESAIPKLTMKQFKQHLYTFMPGLK